MEKKKSPRKWSGNAAGRGSERNTFAKSTEVGRRGPRELEWKKKNTADRKGTLQDANKSVIQKQMSGLMESNPPDRIPRQKRQRACRSRWKGIMGRAEKTDKKSYGKGP